MQCSKLSEVHVRSTCFKLGQELVQLQYEHGLFFFKLFKVMKGDIKEPTAIHGNGHSWRLLATQHFVATNHPSWSDPCKSKCLHSILLLVLQHGHLSGNGTASGFEMADRVKVVICTSTAASGTSQAICRVMAPLNSLNFVSVIRELVTKH